MTKRSREAVDGYVPDELSFQVVPGSDEGKLRKSLERMKSVYEIHQTVVGDPTFGSIFLLKVNSRFRGRVWTSLQSNPSVGIAGRVARRDLAETPF